MLMLSVSGCRGVVGETLTPAVASRYAASFAAFLTSQTAAKHKPLVVLGRDGRKGCAMVHHAAVSGLVSAGCDVLDLGVAMTPTVAVLTDATAREHAGRVVAGMVLTASHNPQQWNGLKCLLRFGDHAFSSAAAPPAHLAAGIIETFKSSRELTLSWDKLGEVSHSHNAAQVHVQRVLTAMRESGLCDKPETLGTGLRVGVDCVNASASVAAPMMLAALGVDHAEVLFAHATGPQAGLFPHPPEPTKDNLSQPGGLCDAMRAKQLDVGFALDPDADRLALVDSAGVFVGEEYTLALGATALLDGGTAGNAKGLGAAPVFATNLSTSRMLDDVVAKFGGTVLRTPVGEANVVETMKQRGALAGGEGNGGLIWPRVCFVRDSLSAMALTIWLLSAKGGGRGAKRSLSQLIASVPSYAIEKRKVDLASKDQASAAVAKVSTHFAQQHVDTRDGAWINMTKGPLAGKAWLHVRASNTEPIMRLIAEAPTSAQANALLDEAAKAIG
jgi:phosphomannomutase